MVTIYDIRDLDKILKDEKMVVVYFSSDTCNICKVLKPKVSDLLSTHFPRIRMVYIDIEKSPLIAGQNSVFSIPAILLFINGKENARFSRNVNMFELEQAITRPYEMICR